MFGLFKSYSMSQLITVGLLILGALINVFFIICLKINNLGFFIILTVWLMSPYIACFFSVFYRERKSLISAVFLFFITALFFADIVLINPDPQGGLGVLMVPIFQFAVVSLGIFFRHIFDLMKNKR